MAFGSCLAASPRRTRSLRAWWSGSWLAQRWLSETVLTHALATASETATKGGAGPSNGEAALRPTGHKIRDFSVGNLMGFAVLASTFESESLTAWNLEV